MAANRYTPMGYEQITGLSTVKGLADIPAGASIAMIRADGQGVRFREDGTAPTDAIGFPIEAGETLIYEGDFTLIKFIEQTASAVIDVAYYS